MSTHTGAVRSFDLGGPGSAGRRWVARCRCGVVGTSGAWREALEFLTEHLEITARLRATWLANNPGPDMRGEYWLPVVHRNGNGRASRVPSLPRRVARLVNAFVRVVLGLQ
jgi:hypothetical protein